MHGTLSCYTIPVLLVYRSAVMEANTVSLIKTTIIRPPAFIQNPVIMQLTTGERILTKGRIAGQFFRGANVMWHRSVGSIAVGCSSRAVMPLLRTELSLLLPTPQQILTLLFSGPNNPRIRKLPLRMRGSGPHLIHGSLDPHESAPKRHLDRFSRLCTTHPCGHHT